MRKSPIDWSANRNLLETESTKTVTKLLAIPTATVYAARKRMGIPSPIDESRQWTQGDLEVLRTHRDKESASMLGRTLEAVKTARKRFAMPSQIKAPPRIDWETHGHLLGTDSDAEIALIIGCSMGAVRTKRQRMGISAFYDKPNPRSLDWSGWTELLGQIADSQLAKLMCCSRASVSKKRVSLNIAEYERTIDVDGIIELCGILGDHQIADIFNVGTSLVGRLRKGAGIKTAHLNHINKHKHLLGTMVDKKLAAQLKLNIKTIARWREQEGIPPYRSHS